MSDIKFFLGHTQAPTSSERDFKPNTSHPFRCGNWIVAHNGVLTNFDKLKTLVRKKKKFNNVDSSIIPALLDEYSSKDDNEIEIISNTLELLEGTFGLWIFSQASGNTYIARSGSTIYGDFLTNDFSSLPYENFVAYEEGIIYMFTPEGTTSVGMFTPNSPFFTL